MAKVRRIVRQPLLEVRPRLLNRIPLWRVRRQKHYCQSVPRSGHITFLRFQKKNSGTATGTDIVNIENSVISDGDPIITVLEKIPVVNCGGADFNFYMPNVFFVFRYLVAEEFAGEILNDTKYSRFLTIESNYNININKNVMADDIPYDFVYLTADIAQIISERLLLYWYKVEYPDFDNPWWNKSYKDELAIKKVLLLCPSSINLPFSSTICFNKQMDEDYGIKSPYELVKSGDWIMDKFLKYARSST